MRLRAKGSDQIKVPFLALIVDCLPTNQIYNTLELVFDTDRNLDCRSRNLELRPNLTNDSPGICTGSKKMS